LSSQQSSHEFWFSQLKERLKQQRYASAPTRRRIAVAERFLAYLDRKHIAIEATDPSSLYLYLQDEMDIFRQRHGCDPRSSTADWRRSHTAGIEMLLRLVHGQWPPAPVASTPHEIFSRDLCLYYDEWMRDLRGLSVVTRRAYCAEAHCFLVWLEERGIQQSLDGLALADVDAYMTFRAKSQRRNSVRSLATKVRSFLHHLRGAGRTCRDLSNAVIGPTLYAFESIPSLLRQEDIQMVVKTTQLDHSKRGLRDYAILLLLSTYGLRAGEITSLQLDDIDWRGDVLRIRHSKTGAYSELPLLPAVGNAILDYLRKGRPQTQSRAIFLVDHAPYGPFRSGSSLYWVVRSRLIAAGIHCKGKQGPHTFRHACAVNRLRASVSVKEIGDVLGHRSASSTAVYLKLATEDLRAVALEIPSEVSA
jgi:integrase/recombinase XerD